MSNAVGPIVETSAVAAPAEATPELTSASTTFAKSAQPALADQKIQPSSRVIPVTAEDIPFLPKVFGPENCNIQALGVISGVIVMTAADSTKILLEGGTKRDRKEVGVTLTKMLNLARQGVEIMPGNVDAIYRSNSRAHQAILRIHPKTTNFNVNFKPFGERQEQLHDLIEDKPITFAAGPAGTGKTLTVVAKACEALQEGKIDQIIYTRTMVGTEVLGPLPGKVDERNDPYMAPFYQALDKVIGNDARRELTKAGKIKTQAFALIGGINFGKAYVILDEAQNTTTEQMHTFLTRLEDDENARLIIMGDPVRQSFLGYDRTTGQKMESGFSYYLAALAKDPDFGVVEFTSEDVRRHKIVRKVIELAAAYEEARLVNGSKYQLPRNAYTGNGNGNGNGHGHRPITVPASGSEPS